MDTPRTFCGTVVHGEPGKGDKLLGRIVSATYEAARNNKRQIDQFPDFNPYLDELQQLSGEGSKDRPPEIYKVCAQQGEALIVKEAFFKEFSNMSEFEGLIESHNKSYNPENLRLKGPAPSPKKVETKAVLVEPAQPLSADTIAALPNA